VDKLAERADPFLYVGVQLSQSHWRYFDGSFPFLPCFARTASFWKNDAVDR